MKLKMTVLGGIFLAALSVLGKQKARQAGKASKARKVAYQVERERHDVSAERDFDENAIQTQDSEGGHIPSAKPVLASL